ncbi:claudin-10 [Gasterosteus aculeatus]
MKIRVVQIWGFLMTVLGWIFVACTMAMEGWKISAIGGMGGSSIVKVAWFWSSLWRSCFTDSTAVTNCYDYPMLWSVEGHIQIVRGLLMAALSLGVLGFVLSLLGMECTYIGGKERSKYRKIYAGAWCHIISGFMSTCGYAVYAQYVSVEYFSPDFDGLRYDLGTPMFLGWVGSAFHLTGGFFYVWSVCKPLCGGETTVIKIKATKIQTLPDPEQNQSAPAVSESSSETKLSSVSELSSESELSSGSERSDLSAISSRSAHTSTSGRTAGSGRWSETSRTTGSAVWSMSSASTLSESRSSRTASSLSSSSRSKSSAYSQNSYI